MTFLPSRRLLLAALSSASLIAGVLLVPGLASGGTDNTCDGGELCAYGDNEFGGELVDIRRVGNVSNALANRMDDEASSVKNRRGKISFLYSEPDGEGARFCIEPRERIPDLGARGFNDVASSALLHPRREECPTLNNGVCEGGELCVWSSNNFAGQLVEIAKVGEITNKLANQMDDEASSVKNRRGKVSVLFAERNGEGERFCIEPHAQLPALPAFNDMASSAKLSGRRTTCPGPGP